MNYDKDEALTTNKITSYDHTTDDIDATAFSLFVNDIVTGMQNAADNEQEGEPSAVHSPFKKRKEELSQNASLSRSDSDKRSRYSLLIPVSQQLHSFGKLAIEDAAGDKDDDSYKISSGDLHLSAKTEKVQLTGSAATFGPLNKASIGKGQRSGKDKKKEEEKEKKKKKQRAAKQAWPSHDDGSKPVLLFPKSESALQAKWTAETFETSSVLAAKAERWPIFGANNLYPIGGSLESEGLSLPTIVESNEDWHRPASSLHPAGASQRELELTPSAFPLSSQYPAPMSSSSSSSSLPLYAEPFSNELSRLYCSTSPFSASGTSLFMDMVADLSAFSPQTSASQRPQPSGGNEQV